MKDNPAFVIGDYARVNRNILETFASATGRSLIGYTGTITKIVREPSSQWITVSGHHTGIDDFMASELDLVLE